MQTNSLKYKSLKNASYNMMGYVWMLIFSVFITPIIVIKLGIGEYGIYIFVSTLISLIGLIDLGVSTAATKTISEYWATGDYDRLKALIYSLNSVYLIMGIMGFFIFLVIGQLYQHSLLLIFIIAGCIFFMNAINSVYVIIPSALQRYDISNKTGMLQLSLIQITTLLLVIYGFGVTSILVTQLVFTVLFSFIFFYFSSKLISTSRFKLCLNVEEIKKIYSFGVASTIHAASNSALTYFDRLLIPIFFGTTQLTYYTLPSSVAGKVPGISNNLSGILFPMASSLSSIGNLEAVKLLYIRSMRLITIISAAIITSVIFFAEPIMRYWLNDDFAANSTRVLIILSLTNFILALWGPLTTFLLGLGKVRSLIYSSSVMAVLNIILLFILLPRYNIEGASFAYLLSLFPVIYMIYFTERKLLKLTHRFTYYVNLYSKIAFIVVISYILHYWFIFSLVNNFTSLFVTGPLSVLLYLILYKIFGFFELEDSSDIKNFMVITLSKLPFQIRKNQVR